MKGRIIDHTKKNGQAVTHHFYKSTIPPPEYSVLVCGSAKANQSDACDGNNPMLWHLYKANPTQAMCPKTKTIFCPTVPVPACSNVLNVACVVVIADKGFISIIAIIMMGKIDIVEPDMYINSKFIGICFSGPIAMSHDFLMMRWVCSEFLLIASVSTTPWIDGL